MHVTVQAKGIAALCVYFFTTANMAGVKLEADIVKNVFSLWKKRNNLLYINFIVVNFPLLQMSCFVNQCKFLGCWLKRDFKLHDTVSHVNLDACYSTGKGHCNIMRVFKIHRIARKFHKKNTCETLKRLK